MSTQDDAIFTEKEGKVMVAVIVTILLIVLGFLFFGNQQETYCGKVVRLIEVPSIEYKRN